ncbi:hypothetical protein EON63_21660 [archaeon]|nr:MAG: hypothetical protein EON63_21660 [archaeon]
MCISIYPQTHTHTQTCISHVCQHVNIGVWCVWYVWAFLCLDCFSMLPIQPNLLYAYLHIYMLESGSQPHAGLKNHDRS